ncbi:unnamed protein product [Microthlaspi erraticum]|uniref:Integrase catalytic domain-containing protein n=1 Tax=Microthlaspi erraticum TaxID=1685480 RepID=A0A6D2JKJ6_9BRAS|nr:unnamed protein product [Microthlaspi erraticum]
MCGSRYFLIILDDFSRALWIYLLPDKQQAPKSLKDFIAMVERQFGKRVKTIRSDNGSEFICLNGFFREHGILHETSCVATPQQNGRVERKHRHILNVARALRFQASLPLEFWGQCVLAAGYIINRTPTTILRGKTPFELLYNRPPPINHLRVFGCLCYVHNLHHGGDKFAPRSKKSVFLGYPFGKKGWRVYDLETRKMLISRNVIFCEDKFPFSTPSTIDRSPITSGPSILVRPLVFDIDDFDDILPAVEIVPPDLDPTPTLVVPTPLIPAPPEPSSPSEETIISPSEPPNPTSPVAAVLPLVSVTEELGRGKRDRKLPSKLNDYVLKTTSAELPKHYSQAVLDKRFRDAMKNEIEALDESQTWTIETLPPGKTALGCQWVFTIKYKSDGSVERYKARLVVLGNNQIEGEDFGETFAPVVKMNTIRICLEVSAAKNWEIHQMDVHNAFLHGDLEEEVFMKLPPGFRTKDSSQVCRLHKSLYGLRQAPRCWFAKLSTALLEYGFTQCLSDYSLFLYNRDGKQMYVLVYVDDLVISGNSIELMTAFKDYLSSQFRMKDLGVLKYFLGIEVARSPKGIYLCQRKYALDIISETGLLGARPVKFPLEQNHRLSFATGDDIPDPKRYRRLVGHLIYLAATRPDISYAIHILTRFMQHPKAAHWEAALRVVRFLKNNPGQGILLRADCPLTVTGWCDSDWNGCPLTRRSLTGYFIQLGNSPVSWKAKLQDTVFLSSAEAEYRAMQYAVKEIKWMKAFLLSLGIDHSAPIALFCDNKAAIHIAANPVFHERTKHIENDCHFVRDAWKDGIITMKHVSTDKQLADILTKALGAAEFENFKFKMGICDLHAPS